MVAMTDHSLGGGMILDDLEKAIGQSNQEAGGGAHANAAPCVKASSASEELPQAASTVPNGDDGDHSPAVDAYLGQNGPETAQMQDAVPQTGEADPTFWHIISVRPHYAGPEP